MVHKIVFISEIKPPGPLKLISSPSFVLLKAEHRRQRRHSCPHCECRRLESGSTSETITAAFSFTLLSIGGKDMTCEAASLSSKSLVLIVLSWGFLVSCAFNAQLTSVLAASKPTPPLRSLEDLLNSKIFTPIMKEKGIVTEYFQSAAKGTPGAFSFHREKCMTQLLLEKSTFISCYTAASALWVPAMALNYASCF